jgi:hypothetical protein
MKSLSGPWAGRLLGLSLVFLCGMAGCITVHRPGEPSPTMPSPTAPPTPTAARTAAAEEKPTRSWLDILLFRSGQPRTAEEGAPEPAPPPPNNPTARPSRWWHVGNLLFFWWPKKKPPPPAAAPLFASGTIFSVNQPGGFAILEAPQAQQLPPGTILSTLENGRITATVRLTADRRPPFIVADLLEGVPSRGQAVYAVRLD